MLNRALRINDPVSREIDEERDRQRQPNDQPQRVKNQRDDQGNPRERKGARIEQKMEIKEAGDSVRRGNAVHDQNTRVSPARPARRRAARMTNRS